MCLFIETIKIKNGLISHPDAHNERMTRTSRDFFGNKVFLKVEDLINPEQLPPQPVIRCTISYGFDGIQDIRFTPYLKRKINSLGIVNDDDIDYSYKFADRKRLTYLKDLRDDCDEIIIVKNGKVSDTSFSNLIFFDGIEYLTPANPLLNGTKRTQLLQEGLIREATIIPGDLQAFQYAGLINTMLEIEDYRIENILP
jgi:4-amino-4-deoxychorismate lyase